MPDQINQIRLVIPRIIEQPTWGGDYILGYKSWSDKDGFRGLKIGQSYELFSGSKLRKGLNRSDDPAFTGETGYAMRPEIFEYNGDQNDVIALQDLIDRAPEAVLGRTARKKHGDIVRVLIKFTQAMGNSFQMHAREQDESDRWKAKPESWYYFEPGLLTLGIKNREAWAPYENTCRDIDSKLKIWVDGIKDGRHSVNEAKTGIREYIKDRDPWQYVNLVKADKDAIIDLSLGGLHHSWEEDIENYPLGNIVYELCLDVMDPVSSIRSFDKGKLKPDGTARQVHLDDYFGLIDRSEAANDPASHIISPELIAENENARIESLLRSKSYCLDKLVIMKDYAGAGTETNDSYHHLFMKEGSADIISDGSAVRLTKGHSCFIPAIAASYQIKPINGPCVALKTFVD